MVCKKLPKKLGDDEVSMESNVVVDKLSFVDNDISEPPNVQDAPVRVYSIKRLGT